MRMVMVGGGLGNQIPQYIFKRYIEIKTGESCLLDDMFYFGLGDRYSQHNGYELERVFGIKAQRVSFMLDWDVRVEFHKLLQFDPATKRRKSDPISIYRACGMDMSLIQEGNSYNSDMVPPVPVPSYSIPSGEFCPDILQYTGNLYYYGYWQNVKWEEEIQDVIRKELVFPVPTNPQVKQLLHQMSQSEASVAVHFRRGDFIQLGWHADPRYYYKALELLRKKLNKPTFYIFSDDIPWMKEHIGEYGFDGKDEIVFVEGNMNGSNYLDMQLMSVCRAIVCAPRSSFSRLAGRLSQRSDKIILDPTNISV